jgi:hypothetical protein
VELSHDVLARWIRLRRECKRNAAQQEQDDCERDIFCFHKFISFLFWPSLSPRQ